MEYIKTSEYGTAIDVYFDGEKYTFINRFYGLVAIARRVEMPRFSDDKEISFADFSVESTENISKSTVTKIINRHESKYIPCHVSYKWDVKPDSALPYCVSVNLEKRC